MIHFPHQLVKNNICYNCKHHFDIFCINGRRYMAIQFLSLFAGNFMLTVLFVCLNRTCITCFLKFNWKKDRTSSKTFIFKCSIALSGSSSGPVYFFTYFLKSPLPNFSMKTSFLFRNSMISVLIKYLFWMIEVNSLLDSIKRFVSSSSKSFWSNSDIAVRNITAVRFSAKTLIHLSLSPLWPPTSISFISIRRPSEKEIWIVPSC